MPQPHTRIKPRQVTKAVQSTKSRAQKVMNVPPLHQEAVLDDDWQDDTDYAEQENAAEDDFAAEDDSEADETDDTEDFAAEDESDDADESDADESDADESAPEEQEQEVSASAYLAGQKVMLPTGGYVKVRPVSLISLVQMGRIPNVLMPAARRTLYSKEDRVARQLENRMQQEAQRAGKHYRPLSDEEQTLRLMQFMVSQLVTSFKVSLKRQDQCPRNVVSVHSMHTADIAAIFTFSLQGQNKLRSFRAE